MFFLKVIGAVVLEGRANVEAFMRAEFPGLLVFGIDVDEKQADKGANWSGIVVESSIEVLQGREFRSKSGLTKEVYG